jgi:hypothetical protein
MNITPQAPNLSIPTVLNPHTESLRRENNQREIITQPAALNQSAAEKGVSSDKERGRTPAQNSENIDFANLQKKAELANNSISEHKGGQQGEQKEDQNQNPAIADVKEDDNAKDTSESTSPDEEALEERVISELKSRDKEVRDHELAHSAVGGSFTGSPNYSYEIGPDGKRYAVEGEVSVDLSIIVGDPTATIAKMKKVHAAALAPANPSTQDIQVAASAIQAILQAQSELQLQDENTTSFDDKDDNSFVSSEQVGDGQSDDGEGFDAFINQTLKAQEQIAPTQSHEVLQRAVRVENFYSTITQAYEKPTTHQFELTA